MQRRRARESVSERLAVRPEEAGVYWSVDCAGGAIEAESAELGGAFFNLVANAIEATQRGATVNLETHKLPNGGQRCFLHDTGHGIGDAQLSRLGQSCGSRKAGGSGLVIALAHAAIARHSGALRIDARRGCGTSITVFLRKENGRCEA
jgi:signal transduction histidine kinase